MTRCLRLIQNYYLQAPPPEVSSLSPLAAGLRAACGLEVLQLAWVQYYRHCGCALGGLGIALCWPRSARPQKKHHLSAPWPQAGTISSRVASTPWSNSTPYDKRGVGVV